MGLLSRAGKMANAFVRDGNRGFGVGMAAGAGLEGYNQLQSGSFDADRFVGSALAGGLGGVALGTMGGATARGIGAGVRGLSQAGRGAADRAAVMRLRDALAQAFPDDAQTIMTMSDDEVLQVASRMGPPGASKSWL